MGSTDRMDVVLFTSTKTPLFSSKWTPSTTGQYAGTCIFIIILAGLYRALLSVRAIFENRVREVELKRRSAIVSGKKQDDDRARRNEMNNGTGSRKTIFSTPWRFSTDVPRAILSTVIAGVGYLLMLSVMTMNIGYFLSVLGGTFLGSLMFGH